MASELTRQLFRLQRRAQLPSQWLCPQCRNFSAISPLLSGHSKWATIKHDKAKNDKAKSNVRAVVSKQISFASKSGGPDPKSNPHLQLAITLAKKSGLSKNSIEAAVLRGQGRSLTGASLESLTIEAILPGQVAAVIECQTDSKARTLQDVRHTLQKKGCTPTATLYLFEKRGEVVFERAAAAEAEEGGEAEVVDDAEKYMDEAIEAGALDIELDDEGRLKLYTEPTEARGVGDAFAKATGLAIQSLEIVWMPKQDTIAKVEDEALLRELDKIVEAIKEESSVQDVYLNIE